MGSGRRTSAHDRSSCRERHRHRSHRSHRHRSRSDSRERHHRHSRSHDGRRHDDRRSSRRDDREETHSSQHGNQRHHERWELESSQHSRGSYMNRFNSGGKEFEDNGGLPMLPAQQQGTMDLQDNQTHGFHRYSQSGNRMQEHGYNGYGDAYNGAGNYQHSQHGSQQYHEQEPYPAQHHREHQRPGLRLKEPSSAIHVRGIPDEYDEADINRLFSGWPGVMHVRIVRDRGTGLSRGFGFVEFDKVESAQQIMESDARYQFNLDGTSLRLDYSHGVQPAAALSASAGSDWICPACAAVNFSRRQECYRCNVVKPAHAPPVHYQPDEPSHILKVSGLEQHISEGNLHMAIAQHSTVRDIRLVLDKFTGAPRGFAFVHFHSVADASRVLHALQNAVIDGQETPLRLSFAKDKPSERPPPISSLASDALQAAQAMQQYAGWEPKEFAEQPQGPQASWQPQEFQEDQPNQQAQPDKSTQGQLNAASAQHQGQQQQSAQGSHQPGQHPGQAGQQQQQQDQQHMQQPDLQQAHWQTQGQEVGWGHEGHAQGDAQHADGGAEATRWQTGLQQPGYLSQQQNGSAEANAQQWHQPQLQSPDVQLNDSQPAGVQDAQTSQAGIAQSQQAAAGQDSNQSGFVYDSASGYWHDSASGYYYDANTGLYCHPQTQQWYSQDPATEEFTPYAAAQTISTAGANALESTSAAVESLHAPEVSVPAVTATKKKGAVIGSAPKLSHEGLVAAAKAAERKVAAEAAAAKKASQLAAKKAAAEAAKAKRQKVKLAPAGTGIGFQAGPSQKNTAPVPDAPPVPTPVPTVLQSVPESQAVSGSAGGVQGKIHQGKWSRKKG